MPDLTPPQRLAALRRFAKRRTGMGVIVATLGPLTDVEREKFKRMKGIVELQAEANKSKPKPPPTWPSRWIRSGTRYGAARGCQVGSW